MWLRRLKTGNLASGEPGGGGGLWQGLNEPKEKAVLEVEVVEEGGGETLPKLEGGEGVSALEPGPVGRRQRGRGLPFI